MSGVPRPTLARQASNQAITYFGASEAPVGAAAAITPRALTEPLAAPPVGAAEVAAASAPAPAPAPAEAPLAASVAAVAATGPAYALTPAPPVPSAAVTAPAKAHEETRVAGNTSARRWFTYFVSTPPCYHSP